MRNKSSKQLSPKAQQFVRKLQSSEGFPGRAQRRRAGQLPTQGFLDGVTVLSLVGTGVDSSDITGGSSHGVRTAYKTSGSTELGRRVRAPRARRTSKAAKLGSAGVSSVRSASNRISRAVSGFAWRRAAAAHSPRIQPMVDLILRRSSCSPAETAN